jgi:hypothetical protein
VDLHAEGLDVVGAVRSSREVREVELDLVPALVQPHGHGADERLDARRALVVGRPEPPSHVLVVQDHHLLLELELGIGFGEWVRFGQELEEVKIKRGFQRIRGNE